MDKTPGEEKHQEVLQDQVQEVLPSSGTTHWEHYKRQHQVHQR